MTAPPPRGPMPDDLTDADIDELIDAVTLDRIAFAREVERERAVVIRQRIAIQRR